MEAGEFGLMRGTCFVAHCLELVAIAGISVDFVVCFECAIFFVFSFFALFFEHTRSAASMMPPCLIYLSTSNEARRREQSDQMTFFFIGQKSLIIPGSYRVPFFD